MWFVLCSFLGRRIMKEQKLIEVKITPEEMKLLSANRKKRKKRHMKHLRRVRRIQRIKHKFLKHAYPIKQRIYGVSTILLGMFGFSVFSSMNDGEVAFCFLALVLLGLFLLLFPHNVLFKNEV